MKQIIYTYLHVLYIYYVPYDMNLSGVPNVYLHLHTAGLLSYKFGWTQEMKLQTPRNTSHQTEQSIRTSDLKSSNGAASSGAVMNFHTVAAPLSFSGVKWSGLTGYEWGSLEWQPAYDMISLCWSSWQFMYLLWIVHRMLPQREGTVWDVEVSSQ